MLAEAVDDANGASGITRGVLGVVEADVLEGRFDVLLGYGVVFSLELPQELVPADRQH